MNETEQAERAYLEAIKEKLTLAIKRGDDAVKQASSELRQKKQYLHEHQSGLDDADRVAADQSINRMAFTGEAAVGRKRRLLKLQQSPYFGRVDFTQPGKEAKMVYIGVHAFVDEQQTPFIYDWRAPVASLFYDYEVGEASYQTPAGPVPGRISRKRQYRIRDGQWEFMLENDVNIHDDVLQRELARSSADDKLKNIVATIQRDQNAVIRNETASVMVIQGVAGSGKTSIALHRIAFLLYRYRATLAARDVLIISPNKVFADYISNVLPELGEEYIPELGMEELAADLLERRYTFQTFFEQVAALLENPAPAFIERTRFKSSAEFLSKLNQYLLHVENTYFAPTELRVGSVLVPPLFIQTRFRALHRLPIVKRLPQLVQEVRTYVRDAARRKLSGPEKSLISEAIPRMVKFTQILDFYRDFYRWLGRPELCRVEPGQRLEYADVFPLIYLRLRLEGGSAYEHVKHLVVDEMQDYTPVHYAVLARLFSCRKTILGDVQQAVNPYATSSAETIERLFPQADLVRLHRSYRSTTEIMAFAQRLSPNPDLVALERHGPPPQVRGFRSPEAELEAVRELLGSFADSGRQSLAIICKTLRQAARAYQVLQGPGVQLLTAESTALKQGIIITTAYLAKGLEFDEVIVPFASAATYQTPIDRSMLYVACTRAMHQLTLTYSPTLTAFLATGDYSHLPHAR